MKHSITSVQDDGTQWTITYFSAVDTERTNGYAVGVSRTAVANRMGAYGITDPREALLSLIHEFHWGFTKPDARDDPALIQGWVTSTDPDAERIHLYTAPTGADAAGAHRCRMDACAAEVDLEDPQGLLPDHTPDPDLVQHHREMTDTFRWEYLYGGLPVPADPDRIPLEQS